GVRTPDRRAAARPRSRPAWWTLLPRRDSCSARSCHCRWPSRTPVLTKFGPPGTTCTCLSRPTEESRVLMSIDSTQADVAARDHDHRADPSGELTEPSAEDFRHARQLPLEPEWFKRAVFYEVLVRAFYDSSRDGTGDLRGLTEKLDYLSWL